MQQNIIPMPTAVEFALKDPLALMRNALVFALNTKLFHHAQIATLTPCFEAMCANIPEFVQFTKKGIYSYHDRMWSPNRVFDVTVRETGKGDLWFDVAPADTFRWQMDNVARQMAALRMGITDVGFLMRCAKHREELRFVDHIVAKSHSSDVINETEIVKWLAISLLTELCVGDLSRQGYSNSSEVSTLTTLGAIAPSNHEKIFLVDAGGVGLEFAAGILVNMHRLTETQVIHALVWALNKIPMRMWLSINISLPDESKYFEKPPKQSRFDDSIGDL